MGGGGGVKLKSFLWWHGLWIFSETVQYTHMYSVQYLNANLIPAIHYENQLGSSTWYLWKKKYIEHFAVVKNQTENWHQFICFYSRWWVCLIPKQSTCSILLDPNTPRLTAQLTSYQTSTHQVELRVMKTVIYIVHEMPSTTFHFSWKILALGSLNGVSMHMSQGLDTIHRCKNSKYTQVTHVLSLINQFILETSAG